MRAVTSGDIDALRASESADDLVALRAWMTSASQHKMSVVSGYFAFVAALLTASALVAAVMGDGLGLAAQISFGVLAAVIIIVTAALFKVGAERDASADEAAVWIYLLDRRIAELDGASASNFVNSPGANSRGTINLSLWGKPVASATVEP